MGGCSAINCCNHTRKGHRMFNFPANPERRMKWIINCRRASWIPGKHAQLCSKHFEESQFEQNRQDGWKKLKQTAIPTLFDIPNAPEKLYVKEFGSPMCKTNLDTHLNDVQQIMPQFYKPMESAKSRKYVPVEIMQKACMEAVDGILSIRASAKKYDIDRSTLTRYVAKYKKSPDYALQPNFKSLKTGDSFAPGTAHIIRVVPTESENKKMLEEVNKSVHEQEIETGLHKNVKEKLDPLLEKESAGTKDAVTYFVCDSNQRITDSSDDFSAILTDDNSQLKVSSSTNDVVQASPSMSNIQKEEFKTLELLVKISVLESKVNKLREERKKDKRKIKTLIQSKHHYLKKIAALKESITVLKQQKNIAHTKSEHLNETSLS